MSAVYDLSMRPSPFKYVVMDLLCADDDGVEFSYEFLIYPAYATLRVEAITSLGPGVKVDVEGLDGPITVLGKLKDVKRRLFGE